MAHISNISIPARFVFRPYRVQWERTWAFIVGWGQPPYPRLMALTNLKDGGKIPLNPQAVVIRIAVSRAQDESDDALGLSSALLGLSPYDTFEIEVNRDDIPTECLQPHENPDTTPDISGRDFELLACRLPDVNGLGSSWQPDEFGRDAWAMRDQFFALEDTISDTLTFLNRWGLWNFPLLHQPGTLGTLPFAIAFPHRLWSLRDSYIKAAAGSPRSWLTTATPLSLKETDKIPYFIVERSYCEDAIKATITIDHLANVKFGICKRHDCRKFFKRTTAQKKLYCSTECAHLANVRKLRADKKKSTSSKRRKNAKG